MPQESTRGAGAIPLGRPDPLPICWGLALVSPAVVAGWLFYSGSAWLAGPALLAGACAAHLGHRVRAAAGLGAFFLHADGTWSARRGSDEVVFRPLAVRAWPGAVLVDFVIDDGRYAMVISRRSAGKDAFRRLQVRVRSLEPEPAA